MPEELLTRIDELAEHHDYSGRSEVIREAGRKLVSEFDDKQLEDVRLAAVITALYPYGSSDIETALTEIRHEHSGLIESNAHSCVGDDEGCIETFTLDGDLETISTFVRELEATSENVRVDHSLYPIEEINEPGVRFGV